MANWFLIARGTDNVPRAFAMAGGTASETLKSSSKAELIAFLQKFPRASGFLVARPEGPVSEPVAASDLLAEEEEEDIPLEVLSTPARPLNVGWFDFFRDASGQPVVVAMDKNTAVDIYRGNQKSTLINFLNKYSRATGFLVAPAGKPIPTVRPPQPPITVPIRGKGVLLEIGHGPGAKFDPGAIAPTGETEYDLNRISASAAREVIRAAGVPCLVIDPNQGEGGADLAAIGNRAAGYDVFCSIHHNAFNRNTQGTEVLVHSTKASTTSRRLAEVTARAIAQELKITLRRGNGVNDSRRIAVLSGAEDTNVRAAILSEAYFLDAPINPNRRDWSTRSGRALGRGILQWLKENP